MLNLSKIYNNIITEASFFKINNDEILNDKYIDDFIKTDDATDGVLDYYIERNNLDDDDKENIRYSNEFKEYITNYLNDYLEEAKENIYSSIDYHNNKIKIYRALTVDENWLNHLKTQGKRLGIYWSWDKDAAEPHWGYNDNNKNIIAFIESEVNEQYVDWKNTLELNMHPNYSEEKEIRLFKNTRLKIISININNEPVNISELNNKTFLA